MPRGPRTCSACRGFSDRAAFGEGRLDEGLRSFVLSRGDLIQPAREDPVDAIEGPGDMGNRRIKQIEVWGGIGADQRNMLRREDAAAGEVKLGRDEDIGLVEKHGARRGVAEHRVESLVEPLLATATNREVVGAGADALRPQLVEECLFQGPPRRPDPKRG